MKNLFLYWDCSSRAAEWSESVEDFRRKTGSKEKHVVRVGSGDTPAPVGYQKTGRLAFDPAIPLPRKSVTRRVIDSL